MQGLSPTPPQPQQRVDIDPDVPAYRVIEKRGFFDDTDRLWEKGSMIYWEGEPNLGFEPLNEIAYEKMREWLVKIDAEAEKVSKQKGMGHAKMVNAYEAKRRIAELDRMMGRSVNVEEQTPILGGKRAGSLARSVHDASQKETPMMGHRARASAAKANATRSDRQTLNNQASDKGFL